MVSISDTLVKLVLKPLNSLHTNILNLSSMTGMESLRVSVEIITVKLTIPVKIGLLNFPNIPF